MDFFFLNFMNELFLFLFEDMIKKKEEKHF
jgi:hypothetical protein